MITYWQIPRKALEDEIVCKLNPNMAESSACEKYRVPIARFLLDRLIEIGHWAFPGSFEDG